MPPYIRIGFVKTVETQGPSVSQVGCGRVEKSKLEKGEEFSGYIL